MNNVLLTVNAGSSSLKLAVFDTPPGDSADPQPVLRGTVLVADVSAHLTLRNSAGQVALDHALPGGQHDEYFLPMLGILREHVGRDVAAVGHRVVHGGRDLTGPARVDAALLARLTALTPLAPLHQEHNLAPIRALLRRAPALPQVACFDTAFHRTMPAVAARFAVPRELEQTGFLRYGAHGLSYEFIAGRLAQQEPKIAQGRVVVAHLGSGASLCAMRGGRSVDTTMGMTPLDGLVMGTRCGALDPGAMLYLLTARGMTAADVQDMLYHHSGLLGVSGHSADMRELTKVDADSHSLEAVELFVWRLAREVACMVAALQGLDALVFTGGIGEHSPQIRASACARLAWLGLRVDNAANEAGLWRISTLDSAVAVLVVPTDEETVIARHTSRLLEA